MSGSRSTESREAATRPNRTTPSVVMNTVTGRRMEPSMRRTRALPSRWLEVDGLDARALLESALADGDHAIAGHEPGEHLGGLARNRAQTHRHARHGVAAGDEDVVLAVLVEGGAAGHQQRVVEDAGADADAHEAPRPQEPFGVAHLERHLE